MSVVTPRFMFARWLFTVFPREMLQGWRLIQADLPFWCAVAAGLTLLTLSAETEVSSAAGQTPSLALQLVSSLVRILIAPVVLVAAAVRFSTVTLNPSRPWTDVLAVVMRRALPALGAWAVAAGLSLSLAVSAQVGVIFFLQAVGRDAGTVQAVSALVRLLVFLALFVRFAFVPFLVALEKAPGFADPQHPRSRLYALLYRVAWPLFESSQLTRGIRWQVLPYLALSTYAPMAAAPVAAHLRPASVFALDLLALTALAVLFRFYSDKRRLALAG